MIARLKEPKHAAYIQNARRHPSLPESQSNSLSPGRDLQIYSYSL